MEQSLPKRTSFSVSEEEWSEALNQLLGQHDRKRFWVYLRSEVLNLFATPLQLQFAERRIHLLSPQLPPGSPPRIECELALPALGFGFYEKRTNEKGEVRLSVVYPLNRPGDPVTQMFAELVISTSEEFLTVSESGSQVQ